MNPMTLSEIAHAASALANLLRATIPLGDALGKMPRLQRRHADFWRGASQAVTGGHPLSEVLQGSWPEQWLSAVRAGEQAGKLEEVLGRIEESLQVQLGIRESLRRLLYPAFIMVLGVAGFLFFMVVTLPAIGHNLGGRNPDGVMLLAFALEAFFHQHWLAALLALAGLVTAAVAWARTEAAQQTALALLLKLPYFGEALRALYFGAWAHYMALMANAGLVITQALALTAKALPEALQEGVHLLERDIRANRRVAEAVDPDALALDDPRQAWPVYIGNALTVGEETGLLDTQLLKAAPSLIKDGTKRLDTAISFAVGIAMALAGAMLAIPMGAYFSQIFTGISTMGR